MKKNFKRNKIILCSLLGLAIISSGTIAFSTWIFGLNNGEQQIDGIKVTVDGYKDNTKYLDIATSNNETITLAEYSEIKAKNYNVASTIIDETKKADFDINLSKFEFAFSTSQYTFKSIDFSLLIYKTTDTSETKKDCNIVDSSQVHSSDDSTNHLVKMRESKTEGYTYLALETSVTSDTLTNNFTTETIGDYTYYTAIDNFKKLTLKWGDYFGNDVTSEGIVTKASPAIFYNNKYTEFIKKENIGVKDKLEFLNTANSEMNAMEEVFKDATIKITATLNLTDETNNG
mgnify:CR=1 FL=1